VSDNVPSIVVVDDNPAARSLYERSAQGLACRLSAFESAEEALAYLGAHGADLLIFDVLVRGIDGLTLLRRIRGLDATASLPAVIVTSKDYQQDRRVASELGILEYLLKPLRSQEIRELIQRHTGAGAITPAAAR